MRVGYAFLDGTVVRPADVTLLLQKCLLATQGAVFPKQLLPASISVPTILHACLVCVS